MNEIYLDPQVYNSFIREIEIDNIKLKSLNIKDVNDELKNSNRLNLSLRFESDFEKEKDALNVYSKFFVYVGNEKDGIVEKGFDMEFTYKLEYRIENIDRFDEEYIHLFTTKNVPVNVWPYARELISSLTTRIGYPALIIEPFKTK